MPEKVYIVKLITGESFIGTLHQDEEDEVVTLRKAFVMMSPKPGQIQIAKILGLDETELNINQDQVVYFFQLPEHNGLYKSYIKESTGLEIPNFQTPKVTMQ